MDPDAAEVKASGGVVWRRRDDGSPELVVVHRPRYDDWSLPKGKLDPGESWEDAALREVEEEVGLRCRLGDDVGALRFVETAWMTIEAFQRAVGPKEVFWVEDASHVDLYDRVDLIPWDKLTSFFKQHLK